MARLGSVDVSRIAVRREQTPDPLRNGKHINEGLTLQIGSSIDDRVASSDSIIVRGLQMSTTEQTETAKINYSVKAGLFKAPSDGKRTGKHRGIYRASEC